jgi:hypothetical protein
MMRMTSLFARLSWRASSRFVVVADDFKNRII